MDKERLNQAISKAVKHQLGLQLGEGYWWYTLEAAEYICAETIFLMHFMGEVDLDTEAGLIRRILSCQRRDGTWALYYGGHPDLSTTIECYWALKLACHCDERSDEAISRTQLHSGDCHAPSVLPPKYWRAGAMTNALNRARDFILTAGGITHARVFTKIHLALFGLVPWNACPAMPPELILMPSWSPVNIYEFSSWARSCIIPLLIVMNKRPVRPLPKSFNLDELFAEESSKRNWSYKTDKSFLSWEKFFINLDKILKVTTRLPCPFDGSAIKKCEEWICEHIEKTEDIFPALAYGAMALSALGHPNSHPTIRKALNALKSFRQIYEGDELPAVAVNLNTQTLKHSNTAVHQQCCISPVWDTPWQLTALLEAGVPPDNQQLLKAGRWLISKQITKTYGDWKFKNPDAEPGGWSFEFENEYFPDIDDTIQVLHVLNRLALPEDEKKPAIERGLKWLISMQNDDGGWGAFDKNQKLEIVNRIPFSDHGACLDPSSPDITGRMLALLAELKDVASKLALTNTGKVNFAATKNVASKLALTNTGKVNFAATMTKALDYLLHTQEPFGAWSGRWGVNYIYGTWCVLTGLAVINNVAAELALPKISKASFAATQKAVNWLTSIQHADGGFSEHPETYKLERYEPYPCDIIPPSPPLEKGGKGGFGVPSQTAWALMGLIAGNNVAAEFTLPNNVSKASFAATKATQFLVNKLREDGTWDEKEFTGTGFPNHFYIRYHGYRHFFPLLALAKYSFLPNKKV